MNSEELHERRRRQKLRRDLIDITRESVREHSMTNKGISDQNAITHVYKALEDVIHLVGELTK